MTGTQVTLLIIAIVLAWIPFFMAIMMFCARLGGWRELAEAYPPQQMIEGEVFRRQSLALRRGVRYGGAVIVTASARGVAFELPAVFRFGHRPIFLPWSELTITRGGSKRKLGRVVTLHAAAKPEIPIHMSVKLAEKLAAVAGEAWRETVAEA